ncbi:uncharacterized protein C8R40DRAFT_1093380 [Lentinula edodes]|uniref:uncharacterized protein n=1 Tax=Lentinula edodes TaxID=5353 RepID=UPI001E8E2B2A|nr:uncharacterized protein C8R40DRAFT_1093380 [Lentinula edodes]KAH7878004.1 hypothetical protein C8R40DRAFT_1093380 [Lentinula edodes]
MHLSTGLSLVSIAYLWDVVSASTNLTQCFLDMQAGKFGPDAGLDSYGNPVQNLRDATAIPYDLCVVVCGGGPEAFDWSNFSNQLNTWLLPWLALLSQLPFGANDHLQNLLAVVLTIGSPVLASYSVVLTVLNGRWIAQRFSGSTYPNTLAAVRALKDLQQAPITLNLDDKALLASLVVLPENDDWWKKLLQHIDCTHTWSISAGISLAWVFIAYAISVIDSLFNVLQGVEVDGLGSVWLWLLPVVISWLQISPKCDSGRITESLRHANEIAYVAVEGCNKSKRAGEISDHRAFFFKDGHNPLYSDERCTSPIYNYSRLFSWTAVVEEVCVCFEEATRRSRLYQPVASEKEWVLGEQSCYVELENRYGTSSEVVTYCSPLFRQTDRWGPGVFGRIAVSSIMALFLQWGTAGAAMIVAIKTPTRGLSCLSGSFLVYASVSTVVWFFLLIASILSHFSSFNNVYSNMTATLSIIIRRVGKFLAAANAVWILTACIFNFSSFFDRCYCNSSVLGIGAAKAFNVLIFTQADQFSTRTAWIGAAFLAMGSAAIYIIFINLYVNSPLSATICDSESNVCV